MTSEDEHQESYDQQQQEEGDEGTVQENVDLYFEPLVSLKAVEVKTDEEDNNLLFKIRAKLYRFNKTDEDEGEWKERGTGEVKLLQSKVSHKVQLVMRREKTHKVCALHLVTEAMQLKPCLGSDRAWLWSVYADYADGSPTSEVFAIKFQSTDAATQFKQVFEESQVINKAVIEGTYEAGTCAASTKSTEKLDTKEKEEDQKEDESANKPKESAKEESKVVAEDLSSKLESTKLTKETDEVAVSNSADDN